MRVNSASRHGFDYELTQMLHKAATATAALKRLEVFYLLRAPLFGAPRIAVEKKKLKISTPSVRIKFRAPSLGTTPSLSRRPEEIKSPHSLLP